MEERPAVTYILLCSNGEYYVGSTTDMENRLNEHQKGRGCGFTKVHLPVKLVYTEEYPTIEQAYKRERQLHNKRTRTDTNKFCKSHSLDSCN